MQNKLNEILELCIEKSKDIDLVFYEFKYNPYLEGLLIVKRQNLSYCDQFVGSPDQALEYMQNE